MIELEIRNLRNIDQFHITLPFHRGLYAITGENGIGKSTILAVLAKLFYKQALTNAFQYDGDNSTIISLSLNDITNTWVKRFGAWKRDDTQPEVTCSGTIESSLIFGSRFANVHTSMIDKVNAVQDQNLVDADPFVQENLGIILRDNKDHYIGLKRIINHKMAQDLGFNRISYFWMPNNRNKRLAQLFMSSGELLLIGLLDFINRQKIYRQKYQRTDTSLILIDEVELALHPSAQFRLTRLLEKLTHEEELCIYVTTHSLELISSIQPSNIYHIQRPTMRSTELEVINPCYPAYATRSLYTNDGFDFLILVEDNLAKYVLEKIIASKEFGNGKLIKVLPSGGWEQTLQLHLEFCNSRIAGSSCEIISILDGDIQAECRARYGNETKYGPLKKNFLPLGSVEKFVKNRLIDLPDGQFYKRFGDRFFSYRSLDVIISEYLDRAKLVKKDQNIQNGKELINKLRVYAEEQGLSKDVFEKQLCDFICEFLSDDEKYIAFENSIIKMLR